MVKLLESGHALLISVQFNCVLVFLINQSVDLDATSVRYSQPKLRLSFNLLVRELTRLHSQALSLLLLPLLKRVSHSDGMVQALNLVLSWQLIFMDILLEVAMLFRLSGYADCLVDHLKSLRNLSLRVLIKS